MLMKQDSYPRFLKSDIYKQCIIAELEGLPLPFTGETETPAKVVAPPVVDAAESSSKKVTFFIRHFEFSQFTFRINFFTLLYRI